MFFPYSYVCKNIVKEYTNQSFPNINYRILLSNIYHPKRNWAKCFLKKLFVSLRTKKNLLASGQNRKAWLILCQKVWPLTSARYDINQSFSQTLAFIQHSEKRKSQQLLIKMRIVYMSTSWGNFESSVCQAISGS